MFCPKCSQEQFSDEMQFCKNCGLHLNGVRELLAKNGAIQIKESQKSISAFSHRDVSIGAAGMFVFAFFAAMLTIDVPASLITPIVFLIIAAIIFFPVINLIALAVNHLVNRQNRPAAVNYLPSENAGDSSLEGKKQDNLLPSSPSVPANFIMGGFSTNELERPPSVTENTTKHLKIN